ncbi:flavin reductase (DIM6/NTAB) family NADH-FMN oxidoreductase RutF [Actinocorallia herbida]|uniref:Flavin reductase (DIM6/NTAB) family NADH-FMN oxidoreductase RutF n=1 Tax=Actinocorallia herbida TaxID=58109 RepID=A0A3N1D4Q8_9ACTN|nr:flavin reductase family protein [Actinocorallia herbida]ROO88524.1 flavin reductase (DIM6/NTAB) family NADH-FMN oxidoreductase RutF [Actinocorallia herbida]
MAVDAETFRSVLGQWPTGVVLVTTTAGETWHGMTASSFSSVSLDPPLVLVCLDKGLYSHRLISESGLFGISILGRDQAHLGQAFAGRAAPQERFAGHDWATAVTGAPVLANALGWLDCRVAHAYAGGDHTIFVGEVLAAETPRTTGPLLFHSRSWGQLADPLPAEIGLADTGLAAALERRGLPSAKLLRAVREAGLRTRVGPADPDTSAASALVDGAVLTDDLDASAVLPDAATVEFLFRDADGAGRLVSAARAKGAQSVGRVQDAFAPDRRDTAVEAVAALVAAGCDEIALDEGGEPASPLNLRELLRDAVTVAGDVPVRVRLAEHAGLGLANALTAMKSGVRHFDVTLGGLDDGLCAIDVLFLATRLDVASAADREALVAAAAELETACGSPLPGRTYRLGRTSS